MTVQFLKCIKSYSNNNYIRRSSSSSIINTLYAEKKYTKSNLPSKICIICNRPFEYRKKWEKVWDEVKYCSDRCRGQRSSNKSKSSTEQKLNRLPLSRSLSSMITKSAVTLSVSLSLCLNTYAADTRPTKQEMLTVFSDLSNDIDENDLLSKENYRRLDESSDSLFYKTPRFTEHVDKDAVNSLMKLHDSIIKETASSLYNDNSRMISILDICASHVSHLPSNYNKFEAIKNNVMIVGIGMNRDELEANPALTNNYVIDLNENPKIPLPDNSFDVVLLQLSIDYLIHPIDVLSQAARVLKPNGRIVISFSNRLFFDKAISSWTGKADIEHIELVGRYLLATKEFGSLNAIDATVSKNNVDPIYAVTAIKL